MKKLFFFLGLALGTTSQLQAQKIVSSFQQAENTPYAMPKLDSQYKSAVHSDSSQAVFVGNQQQELVLAYGQLLQEVGKHLAQHNFSWGKPTRCFNRFYFAADGSIDYYLFHLNPQEVEEKKQAEFKRLMALFIQNHKINLKAAEKFSQCSPVVYQD